MSVLCKLWLTLASLLENREIRADTSGCFSFKLQHSLSVPLELYVQGAAQAAFEAAVEKLSRTRMKKKKSGSLPHQWTL